MKISGTDATMETFIKTQSDKGVNYNATDNKENIVSSIENKNISMITPYEKSELSVSERIVIDAIQKANKAISGGDRRFEFSVHEKTKEIVIKVIDAETNKVIREIPPEKTLDMVAKMCELAGVLVDEKG